MTRVVLDAHVLFTAAHNPGGKAALVIELGVQGHWRLFTSAYAVEEARRNLQRKFPQANETLEQSLPALRLSSHRQGMPQLPPLSGKDQPIFQAAVACGATRLLTGDLRDFGLFMNRPQETHGVLIQTVAQFLTEHALSAGWSGMSDSAQD